VDYLEKMRGKPVFINELVKQHEVPDETHKTLQKICNEIGIMYLCSTVQADLATYLNSIGVPAFKVTSYEMSKYTMIKTMAKTGKPILLSTGASTMEEVRESVEWIREEGNENIVLLQCVAKYPAPLEFTNLKVIKTLESTFDVPAGLSDHSQDPYFAPFTAVALGAKVIEKHFTLDRNQEGPDHTFAIEPDELENMVVGIREIEKGNNEEEKLLIAKKQLQLFTGKEEAEIQKTIEIMMGSDKKFVTDIEKELRDFTHQCIFATKDIIAGENLTEENIDIFRPGKKEQGIEAKNWPKVLGSKAAQDIKANESVQWTDISAK
ncbi:MAG: N-acetylneuraminate synthase family protein, partial [Candidatus Parcubacteria bacterium]|nr:N-acetylneuraminate synthase family protein [Candidatus Parcubacteria bacterium]